MPYSQKVMDHFHNPRNVGTFDADDGNVATGILGEDECGDVVKMQIRVDGHGYVEDVRFKTFGCTAAIAASSLVTVLAKGRSVDEAAGLDPAAVARDLALPPDKVHGSELAVGALRAAVADWKSRHLRPCAGC